MISYNIAATLVALGKFYHATISCLCVWQYTFFIQIYSKLWIIPYLWIKCYKWSLKIKSMFLKIKINSEPFSKNLNYRSTHYPFISNIIFRVNNTTQHAYVMNLLLINEGIASPLCFLYIIITSRFRHHHTNKCDGLVKVARRRSSPRSPRPSKTWLLPIMKTLNRNVV